MSDWTPESSEGVTGDVRQLAEHVGATDLLIFRRIGPGRYAHIGGLGRGEGWAGIIEVAVEEDPVLAEALAGGRLVRVDQPVAARIAGPYFARTAAVVRVSADFVAVWGGPDRSPRLAGQPDDALVAASGTAVEQAGSVSPAKRLADELEVLHAVQSLTGRLHDPLSEVIEGVARLAAEALSCELAVAVTPGHATLVMLNGEPAAAEPDAYHDVVRAMVGSHPTPVCVQDAEIRPLPAPLSRADGVRSWHFTPLLEGRGGLLVAHTDRVARGFTQLCQRLVGEIADAGSMLISVAEMREQLLHRLDAVDSQARCDPLTQLGNRLAWEETLRSAQRRVDAGACSAVLSLDLDDLKAVNDEYGHATGDLFLKTMAEILRSCLRAEDRAFRLGGDEFAVLIPDAQEPLARSITGRIASATAEVSLPCARPFGASLGFAVCHPGEHLAEAFHRADLAMYADKRRRALRPADAG